MKQITSLIGKSVQRITNKGTSSIIETAQCSSSWCGSEFREQEQKRTDTSKKFYIMSARGTKIIDHSALKVPELVTLSKGFRYSTARGTSTRTSY